jgi:uncharacterized phiE125 gp8 family phage protein
MNIRPLSVIAEPITLAEAKLHLRVDDDGDSPASHPDDPLILALITAARQHAENFTGRAIASATYVYRRSLFDDCGIRLPRPPVVALVSVEYMDDAGLWVAVDPTTYHLDDDPEEPSVVLNAEAEWPEPGAFASPVRVTYEAGFNDGDSPPVSTLPEPIRQAMLLLIGHLYENREAVTEKATYELAMGVKSLLRPYRVLLGMA